MTTRFQVQPDKSINNPRGERARIVMVQGFLNVLAQDDPNRNDWAIRGATVAENANIYYAPGTSRGTGYARHGWRSYASVAAKIASYHEAGFRGIRTGIDPGMLRAAAHFDPDDGRWYPSELEMLDAIIDVASSYGWMINLTMACSYAPVSVVESFLVTMANRYKSNGHVIFNPSNEINCANGSGQCGNATLWASTMTTYINAIRSTGAKNLIILNPTGQASGDPRAGESMQGILGVIGAAPFTTDPNLAYGIHHYRWPGDPATFSSVTEDSRWGSLLSTYPIVVEESGIGADHLHNYDPDMNDEASYNATEWENYKNEHAGFLSYCRDKMDTASLSMVCIGMDSAYYSGKYLDLTTRRIDGSWTTQGELIRSRLLGQWKTVMSQTLPYTGGSDINGQDYRIIIPGSLFQTGYSKMRVTLKAASAYGCVLSDMWVGPAAGSGDIYDTSAMTRIKFGGANGISMTPGQSAVLDEITIAGQSGQNMVFAFQVSGATRSACFGNGLAGHAVARKLGGTSSQTNPPSDYIVDSGWIGIIAKIEVL